MSSLELEWDLKKIYSEVNNVSFDLLISPFIIDRIISFHLFEYIDSKERGDNYSYYYGLFHISQDWFDFFVLNLKDDIIII